MGQWLQVVVVESNYLHLQGLWGKASLNKLCDDFVPALLSEMINWAHNDFDMKQWQEQADKNGLQVLSEGDCQLCGAPVKKGLSECVDISHDSPHKISHEEGIENRRYLWLSTPMHCNIVKYMDSGVITYTSLDCISFWIKMFFGITVWPPHWVRLLMHIK